MTAWILRGIDSTNLISRPISSAFQSSWSTWNSSALLWGRRSYRLLSRIDQRFSIGLRSGDWEGQYGKRLMPRCLMNSCKRLAVCFGSLSCWNAQYLSPNKFWAIWQLDHTVDWSCAFFLIQAFLSNSHLYYIDPKSHCRLRYAKFPSNTIVSHSR